MGEWQPIDTAPRDGSWFVTTSMLDPGTYEVGRFQEQFWNSYVEAGEGLFRLERRLVSEFTHDNFRRATHWMPLPPPPGGTA